MTISLLKYILSPAAISWRRIAFKGAMCAAALSGLFCTPDAAALPLDTYAAQSRLSQGRWYKISVAESGMYRITPQQLRQMGFSDPSKVKVYGYGASRLPERLDETYIDDLPQTPSETLSDGSIVFFGEGPVGVYNASSDYLRPKQNPYTLEGYYFLQENDEERVVPQTDPSSAPTASLPATTVPYMAFHEVELMSPGNAGFLLLGEDFRYTKSQTFRIDMPGIDLSQKVRMEASFAAKVTTGGASSTVTYSYGGQALPASSGDNINPVTDAERHGDEGLSRKDFTATSDRAEIGVTFNSSGTVAMANLNYIALTYRRHLSLDGVGMLDFYAQNASRGFTLGGADADTRVWDITSIPAVTAMNLSAPDASGNITWSQTRSGARRYVAWKPSGSFRSVTAVGEVANQNLHATGPVDMVIFTMPQWRQQADRLADLHRNDAADPLNVLVVTPDKVHNEFSSGVADAQAFRKFLKMLYDRQAGTERPLRYAIFLSRPVFDIRRLTDRGRNTSYPFMSSWFSDKGLSDYEAFTTDDIFSFLDDNSGSNTSSDKLRIAVGRIPATKAEDVKVAVDKIERYYTKLSRANWRNTLLVTADDDDAAVHMNHAEWFCRYLAASNGGENGYVKKLYIDQYPRQGNLNAEARTNFYRSLDEGALLWYYSGHGATTSLTAEGIVTYNDLNNFDLRIPPIFYGATCNILRWDDENISGAELLYFNPNGGIIAGFSATRSVYIPQNGNLSASFGRHFLDRNADGKYPTLGEAYVNTKNDYRMESSDPSKPNGITSDSNKLRYVLIGNPALRMAIPSTSIVLDKMAGVELPVKDNADLPCLMARQQTTITGHIVDAQGNPVSGFSGDLVATLYDAEQTITTCGAGETGVEFNFEQQGGRLLVANTKVVDGRFELQINMPAEVANNYRNAALNLYAYQADGSDAAGVYRDFYVYGIDEDATPDVVPPTITAFYLNHPTFVNGDCVNPSPMVIAEVTDDRALNISGAGIGHQMGLYLDHGDRSFTNLADYFTPYTDGTPGGTIRYPLSDLATGAHSLRLRVWDTAPNAAEAEIEFFVEKQITPTIYDIYTDANPASIEANFYVSHDRPDANLTVTIEVFDMMGRRVWQATQQGRSDLFQSVPVTWDLTDYGGHRVGRGIYIYRATVSDADSGEKTATKSRRLAVTAQ